MGVYMKVSCKCMWNVNQSVVTGTYYCILSVLLCVGVSSDVQRLVNNIHMYIYINLPTGQ